MEAHPTVVVYGRRSAPTFRDWLAEHVTDGDVRFLAASSPDEARDLLRSADVLFTAATTSDLFQSAPRLRWVQSMNAGIEDLVTAPLNPGVVATRVVDQFGGFIAEYVFAELLARVRQVERTRQAQLERRWDHFISDTLSGKTMGVAGLGSIGAEIVRKARAFDLEVYGLSRTGVAADIVDRHFGPDQWTDFVAELDYLVLTLPRTPQTEGLVNADLIRAMRPTAVIVNVGRGALIEEDTLIRALERGVLGGAILDVFRQEPLPEDSPLWSTPGVIVTPHISGPSTLEGVGHFFLENLRRWRAGEPLVGTVDRERGY